MNVVAFPLEQLGGDVLREILRGGLEVVAEAGASLVGGHSIDDPEPKYGLAVTGVVDPARCVTNAGGRAGDVLVLTKPLGVGAIVTAAQARRGRRRRSSPRRSRSMTTLNDAASAAALAAGAHALTDVTGFGLLGHLHNLAPRERPRRRGRRGRGPGDRRRRATCWPTTAAVSGGSRRNGEYADGFTTYADGRAGLAPAPGRPTRRRRGGLLVAVDPERRRARPRRRSSAASSRATPGTIAVR